MGSTESETRDAAAHAAALRERADGYRRAAKKMFGENRAHAMTAAKELDTWANEERRAARRDDTTHSHKVNRGGRTMANGHDFTQRQIESARDVMARHGSEGLRKWLDETGAGNNRELVEFVARIGGWQGKSTAEKMFPGLANDGDHGRRPNTADRRLGAKLFPDLAAGGVQ